jgi:hypothetical protein
MAHIETIKTYGEIRAVGIILAFLTQKLKDLEAVGESTDSSTPTNSECMKATKLVWEEFLAALMLS